LAEGADDRLERELLVVCATEPSGPFAGHLDVLRSEPEGPGAAVAVSEQSFPSFTLSYLHLTVSLFYR
jgi:hypothetical protein